MSDDITEDDLFQAIQAALSSEPVEGREPGTYTIPEIQRDHKVGRDRALEIVVRLELVKAWVWRDDGWGTRQRVKGYRLAPGGAVASG